MSVDSTLSAVRTESSAAAELRTSKQLSLAARRRRPLALLPLRNKVDIDLGMHLEEAVGETATEAPGSPWHMQEDHVNDVLFEYDPGQSRHHVVTGEFFEDGVQVLGNGQDVNHPGLFLEVGRVSGE